MNKHTRLFELISPPTACATEQRSQERAAAARLKFRQTPPTARQAQTLRALFRTAKVPESQNQMFIEPKRAM